MEVPHKLVYDFLSVSYVRSWWPWRGLWARISAYVLWAMPSMSAMSPPLHAGYFDRRLRRGREAGMHVSGPCSL